MPHSPLAAALGFGPEDRIVIPHQDDVGMCHGSNRAFLELARDGFISCGSVMVPCPWFPEIAEAAAADPTLDLGIHLTLTSEWPHYRWRPISTTSPSSGLIDPDGYMWRRVAPLREHVVPEAAEAEMRAQIERALAAGLDPTHLDTHMGAALAPELLPIYLRLGQEYQLPVLLPRHVESYLEVLPLGPVDTALFDTAIGELDRADMPLVDDFRMTPGVDSDVMPAAYREIISGLPLGVTFFALHCNAPGDIESIVPPRAHWRTDEYRLFLGNEFGAWTEAQGVHPIGFRPIRTLLRQARAD
jgi:predicted glycoside hydrolase/deacetylase ChbG (UPF0249 family)